MTTREITMNETLAHIELVGRLLGNAIRELSLRASQHDHSKLKDPEFEHFVRHADSLRVLTYGSKEYKACLKRLKPALNHHYGVNRHHPEHFRGGVNSMSLIDLLEMIVDWYAATKRHADGDIWRSIEVNSKRFNVGKQLQMILANTVNDLKLDAK